MAQVIRPFQARPDRGTAPQGPVAGEQHRAVPGQAHVPRAEREGTAEFPSASGHGASCRSGSRHGWTCEPKPRSRRIDSRMWNAVLAVETSAAARTPRYFLMTGPEA